MSNVKAPTRSEGSGAPSIISSGVRIVGNLNSPAEIQLDGSVEGDIRCESFTLGETGHIKGQLVAQTVIVRGRVQGEICATNVRLEKTAKVTGDVTHQTLSIEAGAQISGHIVHAENPLAAKTAEAAPKKPAEPAEKVNGQKAPRQQESLAAV